MNHFADRLIEVCERVGAPVCVGIDPVLERMPEALASETPLGAIERFAGAVIEAVAGRVPAVKPQSACFERYGAAGVAAFERVIARAREAGLVVVSDAKRGDIGTSAAHYAAGLLADAPGRPGPDALTVNSYFGPDGLEPFLEEARAAGKGLFALVRTSNPGGDVLQRRELAGGGSVAAMIAELGKPDVGDRGYGLLGAVVGATRPDDAARLRALMPRQILLVPGFGAQGGTGAGVRACFHSDGRGALVTASRSVIYAFERGQDRWEAAIGEAARRFAGEVAGVAGGVGGG